MITMFLEFMKTGFFAVGGGMATIPFLYEMAKKHPWFDEGTIADMIAISESTPGPIGVNMATYVGFNGFGILGGIVATLGLVIPSVIVMLIISNFLAKFGESKSVKSAFYGIRPAVAALIGIALFEIFKIVLFGGGSMLGGFNLKALILLIVLFVAMKIKNFHPIVYIAVAGVCGVLLGGI